MSLPAGAVNGLAPALEIGSAFISLAPLPPAVVFALDPPPQALRAVAAASARTHAASLSDWDSHPSRCPTIREDPLRKDGPRQAPPRAPASALGDRAPDRQCISKLGIEPGVLGVGLHAEPIEGLAEEAARSGGQDDVADLGVGQAEGAQVVDVALRHRSGVDGDLLREVDHCGVDHVQLAGVTTVDERPYGLRAQELLEEHGPMRERAVAGTETPGGAERGELVPPKVHVGSDGAVELPPGRVDLRASREPLGEVRYVAEHLSVGLVHRSHVACCAVFGNGVDEGHASVLCRWVQPSPHYDAWRAGSVEPLARSRGGDSNPRPPLYESGALAN